MYNSHFSSFRGLDDNAVETPWERGINAEETSRERDERSNSSLGSLCVWTQPNGKQLVQTLWMRSESAIETQSDPKGLREVSVQAQLTYHCVYTAISCVPWARRRSSRGAVGYLTALSRRPHYASTACLSERRATARSLWMFKVRAIAWRSSMFKAIPPRWTKMPLRSYGALGDSTAFTMAFYITFVFKDAAGSPWGRSSGVTGV